MKSIGYSGYWWQQILWLLENRCGYQKQTKFGFWLLKKVPGDQKRILRGQLATKKCCRLWNKKNPGTSFLYVGFWAIPNRVRASKFVKHCLTFGTAPWTAATFGKAGPSPSTCVAELTGSITGASWDSDTLNLGLLGVASFIACGNCDSTTWFKKWNT